MSMPLMMFWMLHAVRRDLPFLSQGTVDRNALGNHLTHLMTMTWSYAPTMSVYKLSKL